MLQSLAGIGILAAVLAVVLMVIRTPAHSTEFMLLPQLADTIATPPIDEWSRTVSSEEVLLNASAALNGAPWSSMSEAQRRRYLQEAVEISGGHGFSFIVRASASNLETSRYVAETVARAAANELSRPRPDGSPVPTVKFVPNPSPDSMRTLAAQVQIACVAIAGTFLWSLGVILARVDLMSAVFHASSRRRRRILALALVPCAIAIVALDPMSRGSFAIPLLAMALLLW